jgi:hypothetical protein
MTLLESTAGVIYQGSKDANNRFISTPLNNTFVGLKSGSFNADTTANNNAAFGYQAGAALISGGDDNTLIGTYAGKSMTTTAKNTAVGYNALAASVTSTTTGNNTAVGNEAGLLLTTGDNNTLIGSLAGSGLLTGLNNIIIGKSAGSAYVGAEAGNIVIGSAGATTDLTPGVIRIGTAQTHMYLPAGITLDTAAEGTMHIGGGNATTIYIGKEGQTTQILGNAEVIGDFHFSDLSTTGTITAGSTIYANGNLDKATGSAFTIGATTADTISLGRAGATHSVSIIPQTLILADTSTIDTATGGTISIGGGTTTTALNLGKIDATTAVLGALTVAQVTTTSGLLNANANIDKATGSAFTIGAASADTIELGRTGSTHSVSIIPQKLILADTSTIDTATGGTLSIGGTNATTLNLGKDSAITAILGNATITGTITDLALHDQVYGTDELHGLFVDSTGLIGSVAASSRRYKKNIESMDSASEKILNLRPVTFVYKNDQAEKTQCGLIAEEAYQAYPEIVSLNDKGQPEGICIPSELTWMMINEIQKNHRSIAGIQAENACIRAELTQLKERIK